MRGNLKIIPAKLDLGSEKVGGPHISGSFTVQNVGDRTLTITEQPFTEVVEGC